MKAIKPAIRRAEAKKFKIFLHKNGSTSFLLINKQKGTSLNLFGSFKENWAELEQLNNEGWDVYMTVNGQSGPRRLAENICKVNALFIDYDKGDWNAEDFDCFVSKFPVKPHFVTQSSPGCFHVYWLTEDVPLESFGKTQKQLAEKFGADAKVCDLPRVMRMPGTINWKRESEFVAKIVYLDEQAQPLTYARFAMEMFSGPNAVTAPIAPKLDPKQNLDEISVALASIPSDDRRVWVTVGMALKNGLGDAGLSLFMKWSAGSPKYDEPEALRQWRSFKPEGNITIRSLFHLAKQMRYGATPFPTSGGDCAPTNILALANLFAETVADSLRYCEDQKSWFVAKYSRWQKSNKAAERVAINFLQGMLKSASLSGNEAHRAFIERNQTGSCARELLNSAESAPALLGSSRSFDKTPHYLGAQLREADGAIPLYGIINLKTGRRKLALPSDGLLRLPGAHFDPMAKAPLWRNFIDQVTLGDSDLADFLQVAVGYTLFGHTNEQVIFILIGSGGNGKGVFCHTLHLMFGEYAAVVQSGLLKPGAISANNPSPALMALDGKRLWTCSEVPKGMVLDEALTKQITGGDFLSTRALYGDQVEFKPIGKLWLSVNNMPRVRHDDDGMWRRIVPIPFNAVFSGKDRDNDLEQKLKDELPGILNWALEGARKYASNSCLGRPKATKAMLSQLRKEVDSVGQWIQMRCKASAEEKLQAKVAYDDYCEYAKRERATPIPQKEFKETLTARGYTHKTGNKFNFYLGLVLLQDSR